MTDRPTPALRFALPLVMAAMIGPALAQQTEPLPPPVAPPVTATPAEPGLGERAGVAVDRAASATGRALGRAAEDTEGALGRAARKTGEALQRAGDWTARQGERMGGAPVQTFEPQR